MDVMNFVFIILIAILSLIFIGWLINRICNCIERCVLIKAFGKYTNDTSLKNANNDINKTWEEIFKNVKNQEKKS